MDTILDPRKNGGNIKSGKVMATPTSDWTIKLDVTGLPSNAHFVYAFFDSAGVSSQVGMTRTAPALTDRVDELNYAVFSCSNWGFGERDFVPGFCFLEYVSLMTC